jgi:hypothetical protein
MSAVPVTEAELHAYVDGRLPPARAAEVAQYLAQHDDEAQRVEGLEHLDAQWPDLVGVGAVHRCSSRCVHTDLPGIGGATVDHDTERGIGHMAIGVQPHRQREEQPGVPGVAVEEVPVVVVDVSRPRQCDGM